MKLKSLIHKSYYGSIGYIADSDSLELFGSYLLHNSHVLNKYKGHIFAFTYNKSALGEFDLEHLEEGIKSLFPYAIILYLDENRGHNFGTADLDNLIFDYCKNNDIEWLCKASNDIILEKEVLEIPIQKADFYYVEGIGYGGMVNYNFDNKKILKEYFYPQTNFYFINVSKTDYLTDKDYINETYNQIKSTPNYNGKIWEYIQDWSCEHFLVKCVKRNNLAQYHLLSRKKYITLLEHVKQNQIHDCSHKNIMINGICHFQHPNQKITII
jgi:hypothetical protein